MADIERKVLITPKFYESFQCIGAECENNCCHHWNVTIEKPTFHALKNLGDIKIRQIIKNQTQPVKGNSQFYRMFKLDDKGNCPCLQDDGWCHIHANHGEEALPQVCRMFPRADKMIGNTVYKSLAISCPEAARKILLDPAAMSLEQTESTSPEDLPTFIRQLNVAEPQLLEHFKQVAYQCVVGSQTDDLEQRLFKLAMLFDMASQRLQKGGDLLKLLYSFERSLVTGQFNEMFEQAPIAERVQENVLKLMFYEPRLTRTNEILSNYQQQAVAIIKQSDRYDSATDQAHLTGFHQQFCQKGYDNLIESHGHAFLNLMLHWIFSTVFELTDSKALYTQFANLALKFFYVRTLCSMLCQNGDTNHAELLVGIIHAISRSSDHDKQVVEQIYNRLCQQDIGAHEHILGLIKV